MIHIYPVFRYANQGIEFTGKWAVCTDEAFTREDYGSLDDAVRKANELAGALSNEVKFHYATVETVEKGE